MSSRSLPPFSALAERANSDGVSLPGQAMTDPGARLFIDLMGALTLAVCAAFRTFVAEAGQGRWELSEDVSFVFRRGRAYFSSRDGRASEIGRTRTTAVRLYSLGWAAFAESDGNLLCLNYGGLDAPPPSLRTRPLERPVFRDDFLREPDAPSDWKALMGEWRVRRYRDALVERDRGPHATGWLTGKGNLAVTLTGRREWCALRAAVSARIVKGSCGVVFGAGEERFFAFEVSRDEARLLRFPGGEILAKEKCRADSWTRLVVRRGLEELGCSLDGREVFRLQLREGVAGKVGLFARGEALFDDFDVSPLRSFSFDSRRAEPGRIRERGEGWAFRGPPWSPRMELHCRGEDSLRLALGKHAPEFIFDRGLARVRTGAAGGEAEGRLPFRLSVDAHGARLWKDGRRVLACPTGLTDALRPSFSSAGPVEIRAESFRRSTPPRARFDFSRAFISGEAHGDRYSYGVVGHFLRPRGRWRVTGGKLVCREKGGLFYREPLWGEPEVRVRLFRGRGGAFIAGREGNAEGYRVLVGSGRMRLLRRGEEIACADAGREEGTLTLSRIGRWVRAEFAGEVIAWRDAEPLTGGRAGLFGEADAEFDDLELRDLSSRLYRFDRVETDWKEISGDWQLHTGIACIAWGRWITGGRTRGWKGLALMRSKLALPRDLELRLAVSESTDGLPDGHHVHYPYHDIILGVRAQKPSIDDGYVFRVAKSGRGIELLREGKVVASYGGLWIRMGSHCNSPRELRLAARARGGEIVLCLNAREVIRFRDPEPLSGRVAFFGVSDCRANFSDVVITPLAPWEETLPPAP